MTDDNLWGEGLIFGGSLVKLRVAYIIYIYIIFFSNEIHSLLVLPLKLEGCGYI